MVENMKKRAFITGTAGQDGSYLAELLLEKDYEVYGLIRYSTTREDLSNIDHLTSDIEIIEGDIQDSSLIYKTLNRVRPHEVYNLAAQSHVGRSFEMPEYTIEVTGKSVLHLLEGIRLSGFNSKIYQASTSELFGNSSQGPQDENTPFNPRSPYGCAKLLAHHLIKNYRESYNMFGCTGILFNHESPRRGSEFVTQKIVQGAVAIFEERQEKLYLGNLDAKRDWGHARDYVKAMWLMMQHHTPDDFVIATGETRTVREFVDRTFNELGLKYQDHVEIDPRFYRPAEVNILLGNPTKAAQQLGWAPETAFEGLVREMIASARTMTVGEQSSKHP